MFWGVGYDQQFYAFAFRNQLRAKWKNLKTSYYNFKRTANKSGAGAISWPLYDEMDALLCNRPKSQV